MKSVTVDSIGDLGLRAFLVMESPQRANNFCLNYENYYSYFFSIPKKSSPKFRNCEKEQQGIEEGMSSACERDSDGHMVDSDA